VYLVVVVLDFSLVEKFSGMWTHKKMMTEFNKKYAAQTIE
jgi:hypothetical protein